MIVDPDKIATRDLHQFLLGSVAPRPIAFASTVDEEGRHNLAPYSFFNAFSSNPPMLVFSSNRRVVDNTTKDTLHNIEKTREVVINVVTYNIVRQMAVTSVQFEAGTNEFEKSGLTPIESDLVKPYRVKESPVNMECRVEDIITLGKHGGAGHLILCRVLRMHIDDAIIDHRNRIDPHKIDLMGRMGRAYYVRASGDAIQTIVQPVTQMVIGYQALPDLVRHSEILTANNIGQLAGLATLPTDEEVTAIKKGDHRVKSILKHGDDVIGALQRYARELLEEQDERHRAMAVLLLAGSLS